MAPARAQERRLAGGNLNPVTKIGHTVRRPVGLHTTTVHALLAHLQAAGFDGAPRPRGIDDRGREVLTYVRGRIHMPRRDGPLGLDAAVLASGRLLRAFHDASATFTVARDARWNLGLTEPAALAWRQHTGSSCATTMRPCGTSSSTGDDRAP